MQNFRKIVLPNGIRLVLAPEKDSLATTIMVFVEAGSKYETKEINGLSHFLEHMCFKGTKKRPRPIDIPAELDGLGAKYNAGTSQEWTNYYAKVKNESLDQALDIIADMYLNPIFDAKEIEKEKGVIIEEINMHEDTPSRKVHDLFMDLLYGDQPAGWDIAGRKEIIQVLKRDDFVSYRSRHYLPQATVVVIAGGFNEEGIEEKVAGFFADLKAGEKHKKIAVVEEQGQPMEIVKFKDSDQTHVVLGFRAFSLFDPRRYTLEVLVDVLGGGFSSRLFQRIREEMGAAYYIGASADLYTDHGLVLMAAGINHEKIEAVLTATIELFNRFKSEKVGEAELQRAKDHLTGHLYLSLETSDAIAGFYGFQEVLREPLETPEELSSKIQAVTAEEIQGIANDLFKNKGLNLAVVGPFKDKSFGDILKV